MSLVVWIILGLIAGVIASFLIGTRLGIIEVILLGIVGAILGGYILGNVLGVANVTGLNVTSILVAIIGAVILIFIVDAFAGGGWGTYRGYGPYRGRRRYRGYRRRY